MVSIKFQYHKTRKKKYQQTMKALQKYMPLMQNEFCKLMTAVNEAITLGLPTNFMHGSDIHNEIYPVTININLGGLDSDNDRVPCKIDMLDENNRLIGSHESILSLANLERKFVDRIDDLGLIAAELLTTLLIGMINKIVYDVLYTHVHLTSGLIKLPSYLKARMLDPSSSLVYIPFPENAVPIDHIQDGDINWDSSQDVPFHLYVGCADKEHVEKVSGGHYSENFQMDLIKITTLSTLTVANMFKYVYDDNNEDTPIFNEEKPTWHMLIMPEEQSKLDGHDWANSFGEDIILLSTPYYAQSGCCIPIPLVDIITDDEEAESEIMSVVSTQIISVFAAIILRYIIPINHVNDMLNDIIDTSFMESD
jgi:hypothetical protein